MRQAAQVLKSVFRQEDVGDRIGGDEFAVLLPGVDACMAKKTIERIKNNIKKLIATRNVKPFQISMGISTAETGGSWIETLRKADKAMYVEKQAKCYRKIWNKIFSKGYMFYKYLFSRHI